jgi:hypothetical protein
MKTSTVIGLAILAALGVGAYYIYTKSSATTAAAASAAGLTTAQYLALTTAQRAQVTSGTLTTAQAISLAGAAAPVVNTLISDLGGLFGGGSTQTTPTSTALSPASSTPISTTIFDDPQNEANYVQQQVAAGNLNASDFNTANDALAAGVDQSDVEDAYYSGAYDM